MTLVDCGSGVRLERGLRCRMPDGVHLVSDHYYPPGDGPFPTLLMRQPYGRDIASTVVYAHPVWFARHGYHVVIQDVRGRGDSEGEFYPFRHESQDGAETIAWVRRHPLANGRVGMYGFSYQGLTQLLAAAEQPEGLACIAPGMTACDLYSGWFYRNGALRLSSTIGWGIQMLRADARKRNLHQVADALEEAWHNVRAQPSLTPLAAHVALQGEGLPQYVRDWIANDRPGDYWESLDVSSRLSKIAVPALHVSGWFDTYLNGSVDGFLALTKHAATSFARKHQYLLAGPWVHIPWGDRAGNENFGPEALIDTDALLLRWLNHWLKDSGEWADQPMIRHFVLGDNRWLSASTWPEGASHSLYLHSSGKANSRKGDGALTSHAPESEEPRDVFVHDPEVPVYAPGGPFSLSGAHDQAEMELSNNLLVYTSEPLQHRLHLFGNPRVSIHAATSAASADLTAKLVRVLSDSRAQFVSIGVARSSCLFADTGYRADVIQLWNFDLDPISCVFLPGDRLRLEIASSAFPLYDRNSSTAVPASQASPWNWTRSTQQILHSADHPSALHLPVVDEGTA